MSGKYIYVFTEEDRDKLKNSGFTWLNSRTAGECFIFTNEAGSILKDADLPSGLGTHALMNVLVF